MRRQTLKGFPHVLTPDGRKELTPRLGRFEEENEPGTLDPRLPRPAPMPDRRRIFMGQEKNYEPIEAWEGKPPGGLMAAAKDAAMDSLVGFNYYEAKAGMRLFKEEPDWIMRYQRGEINQDGSVNEMGPTQPPPNDDTMNVEHLKPPWKPPPPP